jgi:hypothetical protein
LNGMMCRDLKTPLSMQRQGHLHGFISDQFRKSRKKQTRLLDDRERAQLMLKNANKCLANQVSA